MTGSDDRDVEELLDLIDDLDAENERLRIRALDVLRWMEESVDRLVVEERRSHDLEGQIHAVEAELEAIRGTVTWRMLAPARRTYALLRGHGALMTEQFPIFVIVRDRLRVLLDLLDWLERAGQREIWLVDNDSTFPPTVEFLRDTDHHVVRAGHNFGHRAPWLSGSVQRFAHQRHFVVTDPDVIPDRDCPLDALDHFKVLLDRYADIDKVGFGLRIDDLPDAYPLATAVRAWEARFWENEVEPAVYHADIDTTFALYRPLDRRHSEDRALRTGFPYVAQHRAWYLDPSGLTEDERHYRDHADTTIANWDRGALPRWKQRWLDEHRPPPDMNDGP